MIKNKKGFTLAETLVALAVASLITVVLVTGVMSASKIKTTVSEFADSEYLATTILTTLEDELRFSNHINESGTLAWNSSTFGDNSSLYLNPENHKVYIKTEVDEGDVKYYKLISDEAYLGLEVDEASIIETNGAYEITVKVGNVKHTSAVRNYSSGSSILTPTGCEIIGIPNTTDSVCGQTSINELTPGVSNFGNINPYGNPNWAFNIEAGVPFSVNGKLYITIAYNAYYFDFANPPSSQELIFRPEYRNRFIEITSSSKVYTSNDLEYGSHWNFQVNAGDFYLDGNDLYVCHTSFNDGWGAQNSGHFIKVHK